MSLDLQPDDPDDLLYNVPEKPSQLLALSDENLFRLLRKVAFANDWQFDTKVQFEATARQIAALKDFRNAADRSSRWLITLTAVLIVMTAVLICLTARL
jgi:hypothetical protein